MSLMKTRDHIESDPKSLNSIILGELIMCFMLGGLASPLALDFRHWDRVSALLSLTLAMLLCISFVQARRIFKAILHMGDRNISPSTNL